MRLLCEADIFESAVLHRCLGGSVYQVQSSRQPAQAPEPKPSTQLSGRPPNRRAAFALARSASIFRSRGSAVVTNALMSARADAAISSTAWSKAARFARDGLLNPLSFLTN
jgi:hypothetical protein